VFITDWADAKMVPPSAGKFDLDDYIDYLIDFAEHVHGPARPAHPHDGGVPAERAGLCRNRAAEPPQVTRRPPR
jgi:hypothetical protein